MRSLRAWTKRRAPRRLQISEVCDVARDFLDAKAISGLGVRYLPVGLRVRVSPQDLRSLRPFSADLQSALQAVSDAVAERPGRLALRPRLRVQLLAEPTLGEGDAPRLAAGYPAGAPHARWNPGHLDCTGESGSDGLLRIVFTLSADGATSIQETCIVRLQEGDTDCVRTCFDTVVVDMPFPVERLPRQPPTRVDRLRARWTRGSDGRPVLEATDGALILGRDREHAHLVPGQAPAILSAGHCALFSDAGGRVRLMDLGSTNGTWIDGEVCPPFAAVPLDLPALVHVGKRGALQMDLRPAEPLASPARRRDDCSGARARRRA